MTCAKISVGFIGLGLMGTPIALKLIENGHPMVVWGRTAARLQVMLDAGAQAASSAAEVAAASDVVFLCVTDTQAVEAVVFGEAGVAAGGSGGKVLVDHSSIRPDATRDLATRLLRQTGMHWVDAPVSGGPPGVAQKTLVVMAGGNAAVVERVRPVIMSFAGRCTRMGAIGAGQTTKLVNQALAGANFALLAEVAQLAVNAGLDAERIPERLAGGRGDSVLLQEYFLSMVSGHYEPKGRIEIILKDLDKAMHLARTTGSALPLTGFATEIHRILAATGRSQADNAAVVELYRNAAG